nr:unnamed protein product [Digitaria exilis]
MRPFKPTAGAVSMASRLAGASTPLDARIIKNGIDPATYRYKLHFNHVISSGRVARAREVFDQMPEKDIVSFNRILSAYSRSGNVASAEDLFRMADHRNVRTWTIMMSILAADGRGSDAVSLFRDMLREGEAPDRVAVSTVLNVPGCDVLSLHPFVTKLGFGTSTVVCNTLLDAYCKQGLIAAARGVFLEMPERDTVTYNAMMMGCSKEGLHREALQLFSAMRRAGLYASQFTFSSMLTVATELKASLNMEVEA